MNGDTPAEVVKAADRGRYLATLFAPADKRPALLSIYAFDAEVSRIAELARDPLPGEIRLQWWRDVVNGQRDGDAAGHPLAMALLAAIKTHDLPRSAFDAYCEARIFDFYQDVMPDQTALEAYFGATQSAIIQLAAMILDRDAAKAASEAAGHAGVALGLERMVRLLPLIRQKGQGFVPQPILSAAGIPGGTSFANADAAAVRRVAAALSALAESHLAKFRTAAVSIPAQLRPAFLSAASLPRRLKALERRRDIDTPAPDVSPLAATIDILLAALRGR